MLALFVEIGIRLNAHDNPLFVPNNVWIARLLYTFTFLFQRTRSSVFNFYSIGRIIKVKPANMADIDTLMDAEAYKAKIGA